MKKQELFSKANEFHETMLKRINWFYSRIDELGLKEGNDFMMNDQVHVCLSISYNILEPDITYAIKNSDGSDVYIEMQCWSMYCNDH